MGTSTTAHIWFGSVVPEDSELMEEISESGEWGEYLLRKYADWKGIEIPMTEGGQWINYVALGKDLCFEVEHFGYGDSQIYVLVLKNTGMQAYCIDAKTFAPANLTVDPDHAETLKEFTDALGLTAPSWILGARVF